MAANWQPNEAPTTNLLRRIQDEYREMPGLSLTRAQMERLWGFGPEQCAELIDSLVKARILRLTDTGRYVVAGPTY